MKKNTLTIFKANIKKATVKAASYIVKNKVIRFFGRKVAGVSPKLKNHIIYFIRSKLSLKSDTVDFSHNYMSPAAYYLYIKIANEIDGEEGEN